MHNHVHWVVELPVEIHGNVGLQSFKSYGSRILNQTWGKPKSETWWTSKGSARLKPDDESRHAAIDYVCNQYQPLVLWRAPSLIA
jgi:REP element-mobilizing transposase RayT